MTPAAEIISIDRQIEAVRRALLSRESIKPISAGGWQRAWDRHPDLHALSTALWLQRGQAQRRRDIAAETAWMKQSRADRRAIRTKACPACGHAA